MLEKDLQIEYRVRADLAAGIALCEPGALPDDQDRRRRRVLTAAPPRAALLACYSTPSPSTFCQPRGSSPPRVARLPR